MSHKTEKLVVCPYNKAHTILSYRMQTHLHKCRKQHADLEWGYCAHNGTHHMPSVELEYHQLYACPDRHSFQASVCSMEPESSPLVSLEPIYVPEPSENWEDGAVNHFDPNKNAEEKSLIRGKHCVPPSERKAFRLQHRRAVQERLETEKLQTSNPTNVVEANVQEKKLHEQAGYMEPLRPPQALPRGFLGRGAKMAKLDSDEGPSSPGVVQNMGATSYIKWHGAGRGQVADDEESTARASLPKMPPSAHAGAWGRGRPMV